MKRDLVPLSENSYDLVIIGGGITGICTAWDAALRGLSVALLEKGDFGHAASSATLKIIHGGFRYLQNANVRRVRESVRERTTFLRIAPHLVHPLPFLVPTFRQLMKSRQVMSVALNMYDLLSLDRNNVRDPQKRIPRHQMLSRKECLEAEPGINGEGVTGAFIYNDCQMHDPNRLTLSILASAAEAGAEVANYVQVVGLIRRGDRIVGVKAVDTLTNQDFEVEAGMVLNTTGSWSDLVMNFVNGEQKDSEGLYSKGVQIITRPLTRKHAVAVVGKYKDPKALASKGFRHYFITPWRNHSAIGTADILYRGSPDEYQITEEEIEDLVAEINEIYPGAQLKRDEVKLVFGGLRPVGERASKYSIYDHEKTNGVKGMVTAIAVKYTEGRILAEKLTDIVVQKLEKRPAPCKTATTPVKGGRIDSFSDFLASEIRNRPTGVDEKTMRHLIYHHGSDYRDLLGYLEADPDNGRRLGETTNVIKAEIFHAVREEMAQKMDDVVFRRTEIGTTGHPGQKCLTECAAIMASELGWSKARTQKELEEVKGVFPNG
jgi:glycerol-3-phosphate dehydrogenase